MEAIITTSDVSVKINILNQMESRDVPSGASVQLSDLINGNIVEQATPLSDPSSGVRSVCKQAKCESGSTDTIKKVKTGEHNLVVGEFVCTQEGALAYDIVSIVETDGIDDITLSDAIEASAQGSFIYEAAAESATTTSEFANIPTCISGKAFKVDQTKVMEDIPAKVGCSVVGGVIGSAYLAYLKNIDEINY